MLSKVKIAGHPLHAMLVPFPVVFYAATMISFMVYTNKLDPFWFRAAVIANGAGVITAIIAALPGFIDWLFIPKLKRAKKVGLMHMLSNVSALLLFAINWYIQSSKLPQSIPDASPAILLTVSGFLLTLIAGFLGWSLVQKHHVGVSLTPEQEQIDPKDGVKVMLKK
jgi:uncharacterized membrane protein